MSSTRKQNIWQREDRAFVYQHDGRARYPSLGCTAEGRLLVLFTRQTAEQEAEESGELVLMRRSPDGKWWIRPRTVFAGAKGLPRAANTMTTLSNGRMIAPFALLRAGGTKSSLHMLVSADNGESWSAGAPIEQDHLAWAAPNGRPFELGSELLMPIFGALSADDLRQTRHSCGVLRSSDGGRSWEGWSLIASAAAGNARHSEPNGSGVDELSFEYPAVLPLPGGKLLAVLTGRRLERGIRAPQVLLRSTSDDGGHTWTAPEQLCAGSWPSLAMAGRDTVICAYSAWCPWAEMRLLVSRDGLETFSQDQTFVEHGWLPNLDRYPKAGLYRDKELVIEKGRHFWCYNPIPLPPVVPYLDGDWGSGHFGFGSVLARSDKRVLVALGNMRRGNVYVDPPEEREVPIEWERIEVIGFERIAGSPAPKSRRVRSRGRWVLAESWTPEKWSQVVLGGVGGYDPGGNIHTQFISPPLRSGRLIKILSPVETSDSHVMKIIGRERGYWVTRHERHIEMPKSRFQFSDDGGKSWQDARVVDPSPLKRLDYPFAQVTETKEGTLVISCYGYMNEQDMVDHHYCTAILRSHDGGRTWGDYTVVGLDPDRMWSYCEPRLVVSPDGTWVSFMRTETAANLPWMSAMIFRSVSGDKGRTWSEPKPSVVGSQPAALMLPGGELAFLVRSTGRQDSSVYFSRDLGETWDYALEGGYNLTMAGLLDENTFWAWVNNEALIYKRVQ